MKKTSIIRFTFIFVIVLPLVIWAFNIVFLGHQVLKKHKEEDLLYHYHQSTTFFTKTVGFYEDMVFFKNLFSASFEEQFFLKPYFFSLFSTIEEKIFVVDPLPHKVVKGDDGWYFLGNNASQVISMSKGLKQYPKATINEIIKTIEERNQWLKEKGIKFYVAIAPNKHSVYGDFLPVKKGKKKTNLELLKEYFQGSDITFLDLKEQLVEKDTYRYYHKTDTHWNDYGAYFGYQVLIEAIALDFSQVIPISLGDLSLDTTYSTNHDLTGMLSEQVEEEEIVLISPKPELAKAIPSKLPIPDYFNGRPEDYEKRFESDVNELKVVMFRDSFTHAMLKFLKEHFGSSVFIWHPTFNRAVIETEEPDIVIYEIIERDLEFIKPSHPPL